METKWEKDIGNVMLPTDENDLDKLNCELRHGMRIGWYYTEDVDFSKDIEDEHPRNDPPYQGLVIIAPNYPLEHNLEPWECIVVQDTVPGGKGDPLEALYIAVNRLLEAPELVEIIEVSK